VRECGRCTSRRAKKPTGKVFDYLQGRRGKRVDCPDCNGAGAVEDAHIDPQPLLILADACEEEGLDVYAAHFRGTAACPKCDGKGEVFVSASEGGVEYRSGVYGSGWKACPGCDGTGRVAGRHYVGCSFLDSLLGKD
jgi:DnaJ-class molecular chaperone